MKRELIVLRPTNAKISEVCTTTDDDAKQQRTDDRSPVLERLEKKQKEG